jgi:hypothetical protein
MSPTAPVKDFCPRCNSLRIVQGRGIYNSEDKISGYFVPQLKWWKCIRSYVVPFKSPLRACVDCGLVWTDIDDQELRGLISQAGDNETKKRLGL